MNDSIGKETDSGVVRSADPVYEKDTVAETNTTHIPEPVLGHIKKVSSTLTVIVSGLALFSDGYNAQIIGYMEPLFSDLYFYLPSSPSHPTMKLT